MTEYVLEDVGLGLAEGAAEGAGDELTAGGGVIPRSIGATFMILFIEGL